MTTEPFQTCFVVMADNAMTGFLGETGWGPFDKAQIFADLDTAQQAKARMATTWRRITGLELEAKILKLNMFIAETL